MLAIKFKRIGKKRQASFRVIVIEKRSKIEGISRDDVGWYNPHSKTYNVNKEKALYWIQHGAQPTPTVHNLLVKTGTIKSAKTPVHKITKKTPKVETAAMPEKTA